MYNSVIRDNDQGDHVEMNERCMIADASDVGLRHKVEKSAVQFFFFLWSAKSTVVCIWWWNPLWMVLPLVMVIVRQTDSDHRSTFTFGEDTTSSDECEPWNGTEKTLDHCCCCSREGNVKDDTCANAQWTAWRWAKFGHTIRLMQIGKSSAVLLLFGLSPARDSKHTRICWKWLFFNPDESHRWLVNGDTKTIATTTTKVGLWSS